MIAFASIHQAHDLPQDTFSLKESTGWHIREVEAATWLY